MSATAYDRKQNVCLFIFQRMGAVIICMKVAAVISHLPQLIIDLIEKGNLSVLQIFNGNRTSAMKRHLKIAA